MNENRLPHELRKAGQAVAQQHPIDVWYDSVQVGSFAVDLLVERRIMVERKACKGFDDAHVAQVLTYLTAIGQTTCLLLNFGTPKVQVRRLMRGEQNFFAGDQQDER